MAQIVSGLKWLSDSIWGGGMATGVFLFAVWATFAFRFPQKNLWRAIRDSVRVEQGGKGLSAFSCLSMNLAATLGVGNIVGVTMAIGLGGPGAVFWWE